MDNLATVCKVAGIHSKQPWFVMSAQQFFTHLKTDNPSVSHYYSFKSGPKSDPTIAVPDGCIDLLFDCDAESPSAMVCGTTLEARSVQFNYNRRYFGVRFNPGTFPDFLDTTASEVIDKQCDLRNVLKGADQLVEQIAATQSFEEQVLTVKLFLQKKQARRPSNLTAQIVAKICEHKGNIQIQDLERYSGYTARTLQRQFKNDIGLTPKGFSRAIRCQSAIYDINHGNGVTFTDLAFDLGFSDQSHFLREFKKLVSATPLEYQNRVKQREYLDRIQCY
ncbi:helix-turn-helix domain-containing protein [Vibrio viridaestus]|uniref:AraC family transcriptional regulator n=1 Tax=Vibrio viridaestus TaxID=2487322 RepID=A0A3N9TK74_9VIBR|nr:AraC family transcriptional regulator [Vibrio viridaestus]RQW64374.1 AraC family transcriptional regulator [Vibrio viridaestus]